MRRKRMGHELRPLGNVLVLVQRGTSYMRLGITPIPIPISHSDTVQRVGRWDRAQLRLLAKAPTVPPAVLLEVQGTVTQCLLLVQSGMALHCGSMKMAKAGNLQWRGTVGRVSVSAWWWQQ